MGVNIKVFSQLFEYKYIKHLEKAVINFKEIVMWNEIQRRRSRRRNRKMRKGL